MKYDVIGLDGSETLDQRIDIALSRNTHPNILLDMAMHDEEFDVLLALIFNVGIRSKVKRNSKLEFKILVGILSNNYTDNIIDYIVEHKLKQHDIMKKMCPLLWNHISTFSNGDIRLCCEMIDSETDFGRPRDGLGNIMTVHSNTFNDIRNSNFAKSLRLDLINGHEPAACRQCYHREQLDMNSKRLNMTKRYDHEMIDYLKGTNPQDGSIGPEVQIRYLDIRFGNLCNQKCRMCGPNDSSLWYNDLAAISDADDNIPMKYYGEDKGYMLINSRSGFKPNTSDFTWGDDSPFWIDMIGNLNHIDRFYFTGGEPTINKKHQQLLELCVDAGVAKNIALDYNSNFQAIADYLIDTWSKFKSVGIGASIDGVGKVQEYIRAPSKWDSISNNIINLTNSKLDNLSVQLSPTISILNILSMPELSEWVFEHTNDSLEPVVGNHTLYYPDYFSVQVLPLEAKYKVKKMYDDWLATLAGKYSHEIIETYHQHVKSVMDYMMEEDNSHLLPTTIFTLSQIDEIREEDYTQSLSDLFNLLSETNTMTNK